MTDDFGLSYKQTLHEFIESPGENALERAHALGRQALDRDLPLGAVGEIHHEAMREAIVDQKIALETLNRSEAFFLEISKVYDMSLRGYRESLARLQAEIEERTRDLQAQAIALEKAHDELTCSHRELDDFAYIASHDLKEPLRAAYNHAKFLIEDHEDSLAEDGVGRLARIIKLCRRMEKLIADLFSYSRLGRDHDMAESLDLNDTVAGVTGQLSETLTKQRAEVSVEASLPVVIGHPAHINVIFHNLISNAIKYNDADRKHIEIGQVEAADVGDDHALLFVRDNGIGIDEQFHQSIFRIFKRLHGEKAYGEGTGAGLTFVKRIVENHDGQIWLDSKPNGGTTFFFTLKRAS